MFSLLISGFAFVGGVAAEAQIPSTEGKRSIKEAIMQTNRSPFLMAKSSFTEA
jgi:hypothetical protein